MREGNASGLRGVVKANRIYEVDVPDRVSCSPSFFPGSRRPGLQCWMLDSFSADWLGWEALFVQLNGKGLSCLSFLIAEASGLSYGFVGDE
jgi:hypothetical protein